MNSASPRAKPAETRDRSALAPSVLMISDRWFPHVGGSVMWFHNVYTRRPAGTVSIVTQQYPNAREFDEKHPGLRFYRRSLKRYSFLKPESLLMLLKLFFTSAWVILRRRVKVVHVSKVLNEGFVARLLRKTLRVPYIVFAHGEEITVSHGNPKLRPKLVPIFNDAAAVIANSTFTAKLLLDIGCDGRNITRVSPGVDPEQFSPGPRDPELVERFDLAGKKVLLSVGRLQKRKGHDMVLRALPEVVERHPDLVYLVLSSGDEEEALRRLARDLELEDHVVFVGEVDYGDLPRFYRTCDVFCMANRQLSDGDVEGFGIVFLEASACARPVIAGDTGGTCDPVRDGENGRRIDASRPEIIRDAICELLDDPARCQAMGLAGRALVEAEYDWDTVSRRVEDVTDRVAAGDFRPASDPTQL